MERRHDLDWLRVIAFALLVVYHVGMYYVSWGWHVKSPQAGIGPEPWMLLTSPWRMSLLFLISGVATAFLLRKVAAGGFLRQRSRQLLWPLLFGMAVVVPPQAYYQVVEQLPGGYAGPYLAFYARYLSAYHGFCGADGKCLILPTWNHLWFLPYLWSYTLLAWLAWRFAPGGLESARGWVATALLGWRALWVPVVLLAAARLLLVDRFESTHALVDDWYNHAQYLTVFLIGLLVAFSTGVWESLQRLRWMSLALATASYALMIHTWYLSGYDEAHPVPLSLRLLLRVTWAIQQWCAIAALLGFAYRWRHADGPVLRYLTVAVLPLYILHQTVIVVLAHGLKPLHIAAPAEAALLVTVTFALCLGAYELIRRMRWLRPLFGLSPRTVSSPVPATPPHMEATECSRRT